MSGQLILHSTQDGQSIQEYKVFHGNPDRHRQDIVPWVKTRKNANKCRSVDRLFRGYSEKSDFLVSRVFRGGFWSMGVEIYRVSA